MKLTYSKNRIAIFGIALLSIVFFACKKSDVANNNQPSRLNIYLTDAPANYKSVLIDIQEIMVKSSGDTSNGGWVSVPLLKAGVYDLLQLRNGKDTLLGGVDLPTGDLSQIRLILGDNNKLVLENGDEVELKTPSAQQSGLKLNIDANLTAGISYELVLDFDAARSIVKAGNSGQYILKPVIRTFAKAVGGAIEGVVLPDSANAQVFAISASDTVGALPDASGYYKFQGIAAGSYTLIFSADSLTGYKSDTLRNITSTTDKVTKVDTVRLVK